MKKFLFFLIILAAGDSSITAQERFRARGADPGELYITALWYGIYAEMPGFYDTLRIAIYRLTENGKKLTMQYDANAFLSDPKAEMYPKYILADATPGVLYNKCTYYDYYPQTQLWVSFDYGKNWTLREENIGDRIYCTANVEGTIYRGNYGEVSKSIDYGQNFLLMENVSITGTESGLNEEEFFSTFGNTTDLYKLLHTYNAYITYTENPIDPQFIFGDMGGRFPDVYRGGLPGEVYISSWFPDWTCKISFSADTGHTFRHVYISEPIPPGCNYSVIFMSDREPGVFYIIRTYEVATSEPWGHYTRICVEHYTDYGETLAGTYCHDITKNYGKTCEAVTDLSSEPCGADCVLLTWSEPESGLPVEGYRVYRNEELLNDELLIETSYLDENLPVGEYEYYVVAHYEMECVSEESNHVMETVNVDIGEIDEHDGIVIYPNPTGGLLTICDMRHATCDVKICDVFGRAVVVAPVETRHATSLQSHIAHRTSHIEMDISHLPSGMYFVRVTTETGAVVRKVVKR